MSEVMCTSTNSCLHRLSAHQSDHSPDFSCGGVRKVKVRKGLSKFYTSKSQSFSSLEMALTTQFGESALGLAKRPSSQDLVNAVRVFTTTGGALDTADLRLLHRNSSIDTQGVLQHSTSLREGSINSPGGSSHHQPPCSALQTQMSPDLPLPDLCLPSWLHRSTEELCAALHNASLARDPSSNGAEAVAQAAHQMFVLSSLHQSAGGGGWAASGHSMLHHSQTDTGVAGGPHLLSAGQRDSY